MGIPMQPKIAMNFSAIKLHAAIPHMLSEEHQENEYRAHSAPVMIDNPFLQPSRKRRQKG